MTITPISSNAGVQQQRVRLFCKGGDVEGKLVTLGKIVTKGEILVVEGGGVEHNLLAQVEVEEGQGWRHVEPRVRGKVKGRKCGLRQVWRGTRWEQARQVNQERVFFDYSYLQL